MLDREKRLLGLGMYEGAQVPGGVRGRAGSAAEASFPREIKLRQMRGDKAVICTRGVSFQAFGLYFYCAQSGNNATTRRRSVTLNKRSSFFSKPLTSSSR